MIGQYVQNYKIVAHLGEGGMGVVYKAVDNVLGREVALKMLHTSMIKQAQVLERFKKEAQVLARLLHPNIAVIYNFIEQNDQFYMVMEYVEGANLDAVARAHKTIPYQLIVAMFVQALEGLQHAHKKGIFHRDIKPSNLIVTPEGTVKLMDFGIAKIAGEQKLTQVNRVIGTIEFLAPEIIEGKDPSVASDIYATGITMYELLSGKLPFESNSDYTLMQDILKKKPSPLKNLSASIPSALSNIVMKALEKKPENRYADAKAFQQALLSAFPESRDADLTVLTQQPKTAPATVYAAGAAALTMVDADGKMTTVSNDMATRLDAGAATSGKPTVMQSFDRKVLQNKKLPYILGGVGLLFFLLIFISLSLGKKKDPTEQQLTGIVKKDSTTKKDKIVENGGDNIVRHDPVPEVIVPAPLKDDKPTPTEDKPERKHNDIKEEHRGGDNGKDKQEAEKKNDVVKPAETKEEPPKRTERKYVSIDDKVEVSLYMRETVSRNDDQRGKQKQNVTFTVTRPVVYNGVTIIQRGAVARGVVTMGSHLSDVDFEFVAAANGEQLELKGSEHRKVSELSSDRNYTAIIRKGVRMSF